MSQSQTCQGCGVELQHEAPQRIGYVQSEGQLYCQRCYRLSHYGEIEGVYEDRIDRQDVLDKIQLVEGLIVWIVDVFDLESGFFSSMQRHFFKRDVLLVVNKVDLLPVGYQLQKLDQRLKQLLNEHHLSPVATVLLSQHDATRKERLLEHLKNSSHNTYIFMGNTNVGKSTLINAILTERRITLSPYPHTTRGMIPIKLDMGTIIDTPGLDHQSKLLKNLPHELYPHFVWKKRIQPSLIQLKDDQAFILPHVGIVTISQPKDASIAVYVPDAQRVHRTKLTNLSTYRSRHADGLEEIKPIRLNIPSYGFDVVFKSIGWYSLKGSVGCVDLYCAHPEDVLIRKALI
jgi:ribosome biogenesis GTPase A